MVGWEVDTIENRDSKETYRFILVQNDECARLPVAINKKMPDRVNSSLYKHHWAQLTKHK